MRRVTWPQFGACATGHVYMRGEMEWVLARLRQRLHTVRTLPPGWTIHVRVLRGARGWLPASCVDTDGADSGAAALGERSAVVASPPVAVAHGAPSPLGDDASPASVVAAEQGGLTDAPTHVGERGGPYRVTVWHAADYPALQTEGDMLYVEALVNGEWVPHVLIADSALLNRARARLKLGDACKGRGVYAMRRFKPPRELGGSKRARLQPGDIVGYYGGAVEASARTKSAAIAKVAALAATEQGRHLLSMRLHPRQPWVVVNGARDAPLPFLQCVNDPRGTGFLARAAYSATGCLAMMRAVVPLRLDLPLMQQPGSEISAEYDGDGESVSDGGYWQVHASRIGIDGAADATSDPLRSLACDVPVAGTRGGAAAPDGALTTLVVAECDSSVRRDVVRTTAAARALLGTRREVLTVMAHRNLVSAAARARGISKALLMGALEQRWIVTTAAMRLALGTDRQVLTPMAYRNKLACARRQRRHGSLPRPTLGERIAAKRRAAASAPHGEALPRGGNDGLAAGGAADVGAADCAAPVWSVTDDGTQDPRAGAAAVAASTGSEDVEMSSLLPAALLHIEHGLALPPSAAEIALPGVLPSAACMPSVPVLLLRDGDHVPQLVWHVCELDWAIAAIVGAVVAAFFAVLHDDGAGILDPREHQLRLRRRLAQLWFARRAAEDALRDAHRTAAFLEAAATDRAVPVAPEALAHGDARPSALAVAFDPDVLDFDLDADLEAEAEVAAELAAMGASGEEADGMSDFGSDELEMLAALEPAGGGVGGCGDGENGGDDELAHEVARLRDAICEQEAEAGAVAAAGDTVILSGLYGIDEPTGAMGAGANHRSTATRLESEARLRARILRNELSDVLQAEVGRRRIACPLHNDAPDAVASAAAASAADMQRRLVGDVPAAAPCGEALAFWNAAGWFCGDVDDLEPLRQVTVQRRYDSVGAVLSGPLPPTYLAFSEVSGAVCDFDKPRGMRKWLLLHGYSAAFLPGPRDVAQRMHLGGIVLAWRGADVTPITMPTADPSAVTLSAAFVHRLQPPGAPPTVVGVVYGRHRFNGKRKVVHAVTGHAARAAGSIFAGDYNLTPDATYHYASRRFTDADREFAALTSDGDHAGAALAQIVPLGHNVKGGDCSHVAWRARLPCGARKGTAVIDHAVVAGHERDQWQLRTRWLMETTTGELVSDHEFVIISRSQRAAGSDGCGVYRPSRLRLSLWSFKQLAIYNAAAAREYAALEAGERVERTGDGGQRRVVMAAGAELHDQLVAILNDAAREATAPAAANVVARLARLGHAGGDLAGLRGQAQRLEGVLRKMLRAADAVSAARAVLDAAPVGARLRRQRQVDEAVAAERRLYESRSSEYVARHNRVLLAAANLCAYGDVARTRSAVEARLRREIAYYRDKVAALRRREDADVWRGYVDARAAPDAETRRDIFVRVMRKDAGAGRGGVRGFLRRDAANGEWEGRPEVVRREIGTIFRAIDDENRGRGVQRERVLGFFGAFCPPRASESAGRHGQAWTLPSTCSFPDYRATLSRLRANKATSLDRISKEMIERAPEELQRAFYHASMRIATPDAAGTRHKPDIWQRIPIKLIPKKVDSLRICKKRDIGLPPQCLKLQGALYFSAYAEVMPRLMDNNHGWTVGMAARGAAMVGGYALDHALLLCHTLIAIYGDIRRFFPSMNREFVLMSEMWYGLPVDVREATLALYDDACCMYETDHGLADFDFDMLHMTTGSIQGCLLSTEKAKLFLNSLAEAISVMAGGGGVRFWNGQQGGGRREDTTFCADDLLGIITNFPAAAVYFGVLDEWAEVSAAAFGVEDCSKTTWSAVAVNRDRVPREACVPAYFAPTIGGVPVPRLAIDETYPHIGDPRRLDGDQSEAIAKVQKLCRGWFGRLEGLARCSQKEFACLTNEGLSAFIGAYAHCAPMVDSEFEDIEKMRRRAFKRRFRGLATAYNCDRYLPAAWQKEPRFGRVTEELAEARMVGDGWIHAGAIHAGSLHDLTTAALADGIDSQLRRCARAMLDLTLYLWGMRGSHPAVWCFDHLYDVLALRAGRNRSSVNDRIFPMELFLKNFIMQRRAMRGTQQGVPSFNFRFVHEAAAGDPFDPHAPHHQPLDKDDLELFRGPLVGPEAVLAVGHTRPPSWALLSAGVVMRSHACCADGSRFMTFNEAVRAIPALGASPRIKEVAQADWARLLRDLDLLDVRPVAGEAVASAADVWRGAQGHGDGSDGHVVIGDRSMLRRLIARLESGDAAAADEWESAYRAWASQRGPREARERDMPAPTAAERGGHLHIRYSLPAKGGARSEVARGAAAPVATSGDAAAIARHQQQQWQFSADGRTLACTRGTDIGDASAVVQLFAAALPIVLADYDAAQLRHQATARRLHAAQGREPEPRKLSKEELSWDGGPGYNIDLATRTMRELLAVERKQRYVFTTAAVGDGTWDPRRNTVGRAALLHDGTVLGGALSTEDVIGGRRNNYDGELVHSIDVLATLTHARVLYVFDSTSPVQAGERFRRVAIGARRNMECDEWIGSRMAFEQRQDAIYYYWARSHRGHLLEAAVDTLAKATVVDDEPTCTPVPHAPSRHVSLYFYAKKSERNMMLHSANLDIVRRLYPRGGGIRADTSERDALRAARLSEHDRVRIMRLRDDHAPLLCSRAYPDGGPRTAGAYVRATPCPCGRGAQDRLHVIFECTLPVVAEIRRARLLPACETFQRALSALEQVTGVHAMARACSAAVRDGTRPDALHAAPRGYQSVDTHSSNGCLRHVLGVIQHTESGDALDKALRLARPMLQAVVAMSAAATKGASTVLTASVQRCRRHHIERERCARWRGNAWLERRVQRQPDGSLVPFVPAPVAIVPRQAARLVRTRPRAQSQPSRRVPATAVDSHIGLGDAMRRAIVEGGVHCPRADALLHRIRDMAQRPVTTAVSSLFTAQVALDVLPDVAEAHACVASARAQLQARARDAPVRGQRLAQLHIPHLPHWQAPRQRAPLGRRGLENSDPAPPADLTYDMLLWQRRRLTRERDDADDELRRVRQRQTTALAFVAFWTQYCSSQVARVDRATRRRRRIAAQVANVKSKTLTAAQREAARARADERDAHEAAVQRRLAQRAATSDEFRRRRDEAIRAARIARQAAGAAVQRAAGVALARARSVLAAGQSTAGRGVKRARDTPELCAGAIPGGRMGEVVVPTDVQGGPILSSAEVVL